MTDIATYVVSDIHGEYELFIRLLEEIHLKETDTLYVLGDILDRGPHPIQIILKLMEMPNVVCLTGNHELMALECLEFLMQEITEISIEKVDEKMLENLVTWQYNGSKSTIDEFRTLSREMQYEVIDFIKDFMIYEELTVNGKNYLLVHGGLGNYYPGKDMEEYSLKELIWDRAEYDIQYFEDTYVVTGHTPTQGIMGIQNRVMYTGRIIILRLIVAVIEEMDVWLQFVWIQDGNIMLKNFENKVVGNGLLYNRRLPCTF